MDNSLFNDPLAMAGLSVMSGKNLGDALSEAAQLKQRSDYQAMQMQLWQAQAAQALQESRMKQQYVDAQRQRLQPYPQGMPTTLQTMPQMGDGLPNEGGTVTGQVMPNMPQQGVPSVVQGIMPQGSGDYTQSQEAERLFAQMNEAQALGLPTKEIEMKLQRLGEIEKSKGEDKKTRFTQESALADDFNTQNKNFVAIRDAYQNLRTAAQDNSAAGDIQLVFAFMKSQDPNSTVREGEFATAENSGGLSAAIRNSYNKALSGERLTPEQRISFMKLGEKNYKVAAAQRDKLAKQYEKRAADYGLDPKNIITDNTVTNPSIPDAAIKYLKMNPNAAAQFEQKYGVSAADYLGGK